MVWYSTTNKGGWGLLYWLFGTGIPQQVDMVALLQKLWNYALNFIYALRRGERAIPEHGTLSRVTQVGVNALASRIQLPAEARCGLGGALRWRPIITC